MVKPIERILPNGHLGPWDRSDISDILPDELPPVINSSRHKGLGHKLFRVLATGTLPIWAPAGYLAYTYWPTATGKHIFLADHYFGQLEAIIVLVDARFPLKSMPDNAKALVHMAQSIVMVSFPKDVEATAGVRRSLHRTHQGTGGLTCPS